VQLTTIATSRWAALSGDATPPMLVTAELLDGSSVPVTVGIPGGGTVAGDGGPGSAPAIAPCTVLCWSKPRPFPGVVVAPRSLLTPASITLSTGHAAPPLMLGA